MMSIRYYSVSCGGRFVRYTAKPGVTTGRIVIRAVREIIVRPVDGESWREEAAEQRLQAAMRSAREATAVTLQVGRNCKVVYSGAV